MTIVENLNQDIRLACRGLWRAKTFTGAAVFVLALGIAGTTLMFALIQGVLLRPLPVREQDRLIVAWKEVRSSGFAHYPFGNTEIESVAEASQLLEKAAGVTRNGVGRSVVVDNGVSSYANVALVTGGFFDVLGVQPILGRALTPADEKDGAENVIVLSSGLWQRRYGASREAVGRRVMLGEQPFTIVGVMPPDLDYPTGVEVWMTTSSVPTSGPFGDAARREVNLIARLRPGVTIEQATSEIAALTQRLEADAPANTLRGLVPVVRSFVSVVVGDVRTAMVALFGAVGLVLLIASANVANLLLMRGEARRGELAVRAALGAGRGRIVRQLLTESLVLAVVAGLAGFAVTWWSLQALITLVPDGLPRVESVRIDATVVLFSIAVVFVTALLAGLPPALLSMRADLVSQLRSGGRGATGSAAAHGRRTLVVAQVALAVTIVAAAGLLIRSVLRLQSVDLGLPADRLVLIDLVMPQAKYTERRRHAQFLDEVTARLEAVPAISAATPVNVSPFSGHGWDLPRFTAEGQSAEQAAANPSLNLESIHPNYFETFEVLLVRGRAFTAADREGAIEVAIVSEDVAARTWPGENPIGKRLKMGGPGPGDPWYSVVGVAAQTRYRELASPRATLYLPAAQFQMTATMLVLRTTASLELVASLARDRVRTVDTDVQVMRVAPFTEMLDRPLARPRFNAFLLTIFGVAALLLSTVGLYAVMAAYVRQRDREIAIRQALGATATRVRRFVLAETVRLAGLGAVIGLAGAVGATRLLRGMFFEVDPLDPLTILGAALLLIAASALASYVPLRRATRVDAVATLRSE
jgi:putative ABC transport system permease protein